LRAHRPHRPYTGHSDKRTLRVSAHSCPKQCIVKLGARRPPYLLHAKSVRLRGEPPDPSTCCLVHPHQAAGAAEDCCFAVQGDAFRHLSAGLRLFGPGRVACVHPTPFRQSRQLPRSGELTLEASAHLSSCPPYHNISDPTPNPTDKKPGDDDQDRQMTKIPLPRLGEKSQK